VVTGGKIEKIKLISGKNMRPVHVEKQYARNLNAENTIQNICFVDTQTCMLEGRGHSV
jgi:hypothetical protein